MTPQNSPASRGPQGSSTVRQSSGASSRSSRTAPIFIGVAGGTASGKTTVCDRIMQRMHDQCIVLLHQDSFYKARGPDYDITSHNFDHPDAFDHEALMQCIMDLKAGKSVEVPIYDFKTHGSAQETRKVDPADVVILEGILVLHMEELRDQLHMKMYVDTDDDVRLARRIQRDVTTRGRDVHDVIEQYTRFVKPAFDQFVAPSRRFADVIIPWQHGDNIVAIDLITEHIRTKLQQHHLRRICANLEVIPSNYQIRGMHTILRDRNTTKNDFVFYADRLNRLVVEAGLGHLPFCEKNITTPTGHVYVGVDFARKLCGVSVIRSGESMEAALRDCCHGIKIGKILVHRTHGLPAHSASPVPGVTTSLPITSAANGAAPTEATAAAADALSPTSGSGPHSSSADGVRLPRPSYTGVGDLEPGTDIIYEKLPHDIAERHVLLMDPILSTGHSAARAIEVLLARGVPEDKIFFLSLIAAPEGITHLCSKYPALKVITSEIDECVEPGTFAVVPGAGNFGDRYYCE